MRCACSDNTIQFNDGDAYERFMGRWSRAAGSMFLDWLAPNPHAHWLEVGCGTGAFTQLVAERCEPASILALDPAAAQIAYARERLMHPSIAFEVAAAEVLPSGDASHDIAVAALAINFMTDRSAAMREMCRVVRPQGLVAGYVWDFAAQRTPHAPVIRALHRTGIDAPSPPGGEECALVALHALFADAGLCSIKTTALDIEVTFPDLASFWTAQTPSFSPTAQLIAGLDQERRARLLEAVGVELSVGPDGRIAYGARAHAVAGRIS